MVSNRRFSKLFKVSLVLVAVLTFVILRHHKDETAKVLQNYTDAVSSYIGDSIGSLTGSSTDTASSSSSTTTNDDNKETQLEDADDDDDDDELNFVQMEEKRLRENMKTFYSKVYDLLRSAGPEGTSDRKYGQDCPLDSDIGQRKNDVHKWNVLTQDNLSKCLQIDEESLAMLKNSHRKYIDGLKELGSSPDMYSGDGIVLVAGGKFSLLSTLVIKTIRNLKINLPIEVFIPPMDEGDDELCNTLLPKYNAKCIFLSDFLPEDKINEDIKIDGYQTKVVAIAASSFKNVLLLDADNYPIKNIDDIFYSEPYSSRGLIFWPDYWRRSTSPSYYDILDRDISQNERVRNNLDDITPPSVYTEDLKNHKDIPMHDFEGTLPDVSTESGQLMINKEKHLKSLLLAMYYNMYGPNWYYPILTQKASGEGDKETFIAGANFFNLPFYQVKKHVGTDGYTRPGGYRGVAMFQHDFIQDYTAYENAKTFIEKKYPNTKQDKIDKEYSPFDFTDKFFEDEHADPVIDVMFVHAHLPKFEPVALWEENDLMQDGSHVRSYTKYDKLNHYDLEMENFKALEELLCLEKPFEFKYLKDKLSDDKEKWQGLCKYIKDRHIFMEKTHEEHFS
ncbi:hypothetical protein Kpol_1045p70 [Vanderwaltozyma polyspora DSM 70294]|uniref:Alpha-1,2-mannosyltransferase MNN2 n=1 Tax=Vanderwaltozyma polyspora (strain ATCC 22028 / DSM 70294 / BCRC 21397 / CBS 2163 / NBRC 10782 / NRRL Y-8283 / UCD 57-17) TaxID=436907 RepID=A7TI76_VANPO|nr:uncharacterized protein Kpol_1045p70 [Vanderwaltozyma polyspora DSM 70294]EDO18083.1 hypothetical protein Kpol_1045p70 [Vanderwaltozyma polyspora DSM 70294]